MMFSALIMAITEVDVSPPKYPANENECGV